MGSILAIIFGIFSAFSLFAIGYLFFSHRRGRPAKNTETVTPFLDVEYDDLGPTPQELLQPTPMQSSNFRARASKTITREVTNVNVSHPFGLLKFAEFTITVSVFPLPPLYVDPIHLLPPG